MCLRSCYICGKDIPYSECINISVLVLDRSIDMHKKCCVTIDDFTKIQDYIMGVKHGI